MFAVDVVAGPVAETVSCRERSTVLLQTLGNCIVLYRPTHMRQSPCTKLPIHCLLVWLPQPCYILRTVFSIVSRNDCLATQSHHQRYCGCVWPRKLVRQSIFVTFTPGPASPRRGGGRCATLALCRSRSRFNMPSLSHSRRLSAGWTLDLIARQ